MPGHIDDSKLQPQNPNELAIDQGFKGLRNGLARWTVDGALQPGPQGVHPAHMIVVMVRH